MARRAWNDSGDEKLVVDVTQVTGEVVTVSLAEFLGGLCEKRLLCTLAAIAANPESSIKGIERSTSREYTRVRGDVHALARAGLVDLGKTKHGVGGGLKALVDPGAIAVTIRRQSIIR